MVKKVNIRAVDSWSSVTKVPAPDATQPAGYNYVYDLGGNLWRRMAGNAAGQLQVSIPATVTADISDRANRLVGIVYGSQGQIRQNAGTLELVTEDTGENTNPRRYEKLHGFVPVFATMTFALTPVRIWAVGLAAINPVAGRTAGRITTVYTFCIVNPTAGPITAWLEDVATNILTPLYPLLAGESLVVEWVAGLNLGDIDVYLNSDTAGVMGQVLGTEDVP